MPQFPLQTGSTGDDVRRVQRVLVRWRAYYSLMNHPPMTLPTVDGVYGPVTEAAVRAFQEWLDQRASGFGGVDGIVGSGTWGALGDYKEATPTVQSGDTGFIVYGLQQALTGKSVDVGGAPYTGDLDGIFGPQTEAVVRSYQQYRSLTVDGIVGDQTWLAPAALPGPTLDDAAGFVPEAPWSHG